VCCLRVCRDVGQAARVALEAVAQLEPGVHKVAATAVIHEDRPAHSPEVLVGRGLDVRINGKLLGWSRDALRLATNQRATAALIHKAHDGLVVAASVCRLWVRGGGSRRAADRLLGAAVPRRTGRSTARFGSSACRSLGVVGLRNVGLRSGLQLVGLPCSFLSKFGLLALEQLCDVGDGGVAPPP